MLYHVDHNYEMEEFFFNCSVFSPFCGKIHTIDFGFEAGMDPSHAYIVLSQLLVLLLTVSTGHSLLSYTFRFGAINM